MANNKIKDLNNNKNVTLTVVVLTAFMTTFSGSALNLSIPSIDSEFQAGAVAIGWVINAYILAGAALSVPFGRIADMTGRERILKAGLLTFSVSSGLICMVNSIGLLLFMRVIQGIGGAMIFATNQAVLISSCPPERRGKVLGYLIGSTYIGLTTGPVFGGFINHLFGWRSIMLLAFALGIITFLLAHKALPGGAGARVPGEGMDYLGMVLYVLSIVGMMYGLSAFSTTAYAIYLIPAALVILIIFVWHELRVSSPVIQVRLFRKNITYLLSNLAALLNYGATFAVGYLMSIYLQIVRGFDSYAAGLVMISQPLIMALLSPYAGRLSDRISPYKLASFGMGLCALGLFGFIFISEDQSLILIVANLVVMGLGFAFFSSPNTNAIMACVEARDYGVASSILATMRQLGQSSNMAVVMFIAALYLGNTPLKNAEADIMIQIMRISFTLFTCLCIIGIFISLKRNK